MKKILYAFLASIVVMVFLSIVSKHLFKMDDFLIGWFSASAFYWVLESK